MRIGLIDTDNHNNPNLAQMKISGYYKGQGDTVELYNPWGERYDIVYISKVFSFSQEMTDCINADEVVRGGTGFAIRLVDGREVYDKRKDTELPRLIEHAYPDYSLYPQYTQDKAFGFLTRGCPRGCSFCHVKPKEGGGIAQGCRLGRVLERAEEYRAERPEYSRLQRLGRSIRPAHCQPCKDRLQSRA